MYLLQEGTSCVFIDSQTPKHSESLLVWLKPVIPAQIQKVIVSFKRVSQESPNNNNNNNAASSEKTYPSYIIFFFRRALIFS